MSHVRYVKKIIDKSEGIYQVRNRKTYKLGDLYVSFWVDENEDYLNRLQFIEQGEVFWITTTPEKFYDRHVSGNRDLRFNVYSFREYGEPKLKKPVELRGVKQLLSVPYQKCRCQVFVHEDDVWIKHRDYFSPSMETAPEDSGAPLSYLADKYLDETKKKKFIYDDGWGSIVLRQEAWLKIDNLLYHLNEGEFELDILNSVMRQWEEHHNMKEYELSPSDMERFMEQVIKEVKGRM